MRYHDYKTLRTMIMSLSTMINTQICSLKSWCANIKIQILEKSFIRIGSTSQIRGKHQGGKGHWIGIYTGAQSFTITFSHLLAKKLCVLLTKPFNQLCCSLEGVIFFIIIGNVLYINLSSIVLSPILEELTYSLFVNSQTTLFLIVLLLTKRF